MACIQEVSRKSTRFDVEQSAEAPAAHQHLAPDVPVTEAGLPEQWEPPKTLIQILAWSRYRGRYL